ncbi:nucleotide disphospho-sugar-binding domain-containing protein [Actinosynnema sp. CS-041913]|uniref:nucleotide disphospho-sugar-binding domain-containing protein n=1 Tax=Actinosynnema sp. CS-041913 TaxID=3239917 RepID=UPI003D91EA46
MRVLFAPLPSRSHAFPLVPLAWAFQAAGHDVVFLAGEEAVEVRNAGVAVVDPIPGSTMARHLPAALKAMPDLFGPASHLSAAELVERRKVVVGMWDHHVDGFVAAAARLAPDLVVCDAMFNAGLVAAAVVGVPAVVHGSGPKRYTPEFLREHAPAAFERHRVELPEATALIDVAPAGLMESGPSTWRMRFIPYNGEAVLPPWSLEPPARPRIAVTLGTMTTRTVGTDRFSRVIEAAREVDAEFALTVDEETAARIGPLPDNIRPTGWIALNRLLRTCTAVIHHGGSGTMLTACAAGVPQLVMPVGFGGEFDARAIAAYGCGLNRRPEDVDADTIATLAFDTGLQDAARELRREVELMPTPAELVADITEFAR